MNLFKLTLIAMLAAGTLSGVARADDTNAAEPQRRELPSDLKAALQKVRSDRDAIRDARRKLREDQKAGNTAAVEADKAALKGLMDQARKDRQEVARIAKEHGISRRDLRHEMREHRRERREDRRERRQERREERRERRMERRGE